ncbi:MAG: porphobilinogen synthase [Nitrospirae bacterium]|nr:porphobilinogen synthase [Nitrospirota bacterium]MBF0539950.1 porphobilinogen synthase [Nitrospirota bacterium]
MFPVHRPRRLRANSAIRSMMQETTISPNNFIYPMFVKEGLNGKHEISSMPGCYQESVAEAVKTAQEVYSLGIGGIILFGIPEHLDDLATSAYNANGIVQQAIRAIKNKVPELYVITDVCLCEYTTYGHCGVVSGENILNDLSLDLLSKEAVSHAEAGADMVAPSDMMDGRIGAIRAALDSNRYGDVPIMSYAVKYASAFYGPFRDAAESTPKFGDRKTYQMDPANRREALREAALDMEEGADIIMVKPALPYLDIIRDLKERFAIPLAAYNVSGEYSLVHAGARMGWLDYERVMMEMLVSIKRAGADVIITYFAKDAAKVLNR